MRLLLILALLFTMNTKPPPLKRAYYKSQFLLSEAQKRRMIDRDCWNRNLVNPYRCDPKYWNPRKWKAKQT